MVVVRVLDDLGGSSSRGWGGVVAKSTVVYTRGCVKKSVRVQISSYGRGVFIPSTLAISLAFEDFRCLNSYPFDQGGRFMIG